MREIDPAPKVLTIWQPWASLLVHGVKKYETRPAPTKHKGKYLIHSAKTWNRKLYDVAMSDPFLNQLVLLNYYFRSGKTIGFTFPVGHIIGEVEMEACYRIDHLQRAGGMGGPVIQATCVLDMGGKNPNEVFTIKEPELAYGDYTPGRYVWVMKNHRLLKKPIPYIGKQGYYNQYKGDYEKLEFIEDENN